MEDVSNTADSDTEKKKNNDKIGLQENSTETGDFSLELSKGSTQKTRKKDGNCESEIDSVGTESVQTKIDESQNMNDYLSDKNVNSEEKIEKSEWKNITEQFKEACTGLQLGKLLHDSNFGLFEAMSAIEMMDPKMDAGMLCNQVKREVHSMESAIDAGILLLDKISFSDSLNIMDETFSCLVTWLEGHSLAQTVFTNLYLHNPYIINDVTIKAFSMAILRIVELIRDKVNRAAVYEEEDFQAMTYGFKMVTDISDLRLIGMLKEAELKLNETLKKSKRSDAISEEVVTVATYARASLARINFCRLFLQVLLALGKDKGQGVVDAQKFLANTSEHITVMMGTTFLGRNSSPSPGARVTGFEPLVNQRLLPPTFPRYTKIMGHTETFIYIKQLIKRMSKLIQCSSITNVHNLIEFFKEFGGPDSCVLSRSLLQLLVIPQFMYCSNSTIDMLKETIKTFNMPFILCGKNFQNADTEVRDCVENFFHQAIRPVMNILQICGHNRARQRDKWGAILADMHSLQEQADHLDNFLKIQYYDESCKSQQSFTTWVLSLNVMIMIRFIRLGLELELYAVHEYHYIYWYLYEVLYNWQYSLYTQIESAIVETEQLLEQQACSREKKSSKKGNKKKKRKSHYSKEMSMIQMTQQLCRGYHKIIFGLKLDGRLKQPQSEFDQEQMRYNHRFSPFTLINLPNYVSYHQYLNSVKLEEDGSNVTAQSQYDLATFAFQQARSIMESMAKPSQETHSLIKVCKINSVVLNLLKTGHRRESNIHPEFSFEYHPVFPIIKIL